MLSKHASSVERFNTDTPGYAPIEDSSDEDDDEVDFQYKDTDMDIRDESSFLADGAPVADGSQNCDVGDVVLDVNGLRVKFKVCSISSELFLNPAIILTCSVICNFGQASPIILPSTSSLDSYIFHTQARNT